MLVSTNSGFDKTAINGIIEATPNTSNKPEIKTIIKIRIKRPLSCGVSKPIIFLKVFTIQDLFLIAKPIIDFVPPFIKDAACHSILPIFSLSNIFIKCIDPDSLKSSTFRL